MRRPLALFFVAAASLLASPLAHAVSYEFLNKTQKKQVLRAIDNVCGDTWCEGDYNFRFNQLFCSTRTKSCRMIFQYFPHGEPAKAKGAACDVFRVAKFGDLLSTLRPGVRTLNEKVYTQLNNCMTRHKL